nr:M20 family metallopeptidase [Fredinandcohnia onubensis]
MNKVLDQIQTVFNEGEQLSIFKEIVRIPSENPGNYEEDVALKIQEILSKEGISSRLEYVDDRRPNLYAVLEGENEGKTIIYNGHLDTVPAGVEGWTYGPFDAFEDEDGYIYGRGTSDMKSGVASMVYAAICLKRLGYPKNGKLILFLNADEELVNKGMKQFLKEDITADFAIISEPTDLDIAIGHRGVARYNLKTRGEAGHSCYVKNPNNAIENMSKILPYLFNYGAELRKNHINDFLGSAISNITTIRGGIAGNIIPDECVVEIDRRILPGETIEGVTQEYEQLLSEVAVKEGVEYELEKYTFLAASLLEKDHVLVDTVKEISQKHKGDIHIKSFEATCEAPFFSVEKGIPTIIFGPGSLNQAHIKNEKVHKSEVVMAGKIFVEVAIKLLGKD